MRNAFGWFFAIFSFATSYYVQGATQFWMNEIATQTSSAGVVNSEVELVVWTEKEGGVEVRVDLYVTNGSWFNDRSMQRQSEDGPWKGFYVTTIDFLSSSDVFRPDGQHGGLLVTHDGASRMYCWGKGVNTNVELLVGHKCETIITDDERGLNAGTGTKIAYALYNSEDTPKDGGGKESDFQWLESKDDSGNHFESLEHVNACPSGSSCTAITDQTLCVAGSGECTTGSSSPSAGWRPTLSAIVSAFIVLASFC